MKYWLNRSNRFTKEGWEEVDYLEFSHFTEILGVDFVNKVGQAFAYYAHGYSARGVITSETDQSKSFDHWFELEESHG